MSETPPPPPTGGDSEQPPPAQQGWQPSWQPSTGGPGYDQPVYGQPVYGQPPSQVPYGTPQYPGYGPVAPDHPQANTVLVLGILGIVVCNVVAPVAWVMGNRVVREIDASGGTVGGRSNANAGRICGIIGTAFLGIGLLLVVGLVVLAFAGAVAG